MEENWAPIRGYEGIYEVSDKGNLRTWVRGKGEYKFKKPSLHKSSGNYKVSLTSNGATKCSYLSRVVWEAFDSPIPKGFDVCVADGDHTNCSIDNLFLISRSNRMKGERRKEKYEGKGWHNAKRVYKCKPYKLLNPDGNEIEIVNLRKFCADNGLGRSGIQHVLSGKFKSSQGYRKVNNITLK